MHMRICIYIYTVHIYGCIRMHMDAHWVPGTRHEVQDIRYSIHTIHTVHTVHFARYMVTANTVSEHTAHAVQYRVYSMYIPYILYIPCQSKAKNRTAHSQSMHT